MAQIGKDYYEDLTAERLETILDGFARGEVPRPGPQNGRFASEPIGELTSLAGVEHVLDANASVTLAELLGDTVKRITGDEPTPRSALTAAQKRPRIDASARSDRGPAVARAPAGGALGAARRGRG